MRACLIQVTAFKQEPYVSSKHGSTSLLAKQLTLLTVALSCCPQAVQDDAARTAGFSLLLRRLFEEVEDMQLLECAAQALGHLVRHSGQSMSDIVERQVCGSAAWLRHTSCSCKSSCICRQLLTASTVAARCFSSSH